jgi:Ni,Fe-hydrogenase III large subunit
MKLALIPLPLDERVSTIRTAIAAGDRLGLITSVDGKQLVTVILSPSSGSVRCFETPIESSQYQSLTPTVPQAHWFERTVWDLFGLVPAGHPRLKRTHLHEVYDTSPPPLSKSNEPVSDHNYHFLEVEGDGIYEIPVGPIHAGIIEPGHFRFSCFGEVIVNLEIRLGYVHRGIEKNLQNRNWKNSRFIAEAAASDMTAANSLASAVALESLLDLQVSRRALQLRSVALEVERVAMHLADLGGLAGDVGFLAISSSMGRMRGLALRLADLISGNRFLKSFIRPGGVAKDVNTATVKEMLETIFRLEKELVKIVEFYLDNQVAIDRMEGIGAVSHSLAGEFGLVGVAARASGHDYDCRQHWQQGLYPNDNYAVAVEQGGDVLARARIRVAEVSNSLSLLKSLLTNLTDEETLMELPEHLPANSTAIGIVESHRGELLHLIMTDEMGQIRRYCIKDPSVNNWTALAIAVRNNLVADFPLCNKSFSLSYSGHDL